MHVTGAVADFELRSLYHEIRINQFLPNRATNHRIALKMNHTTATISIPLGVNHASILKFLI